MLKDLIDDAPIEEDESDGEESDGSGSKKRKKSDQEDDYDDRLEDDDYDLLEENLGHKISRKVSLVNIITWQQTPAVRNNLLLTDSTMSNLQ